MLVLLDERTFTSGDDTAKLVEHIHEAMRIGAHMNCIHEFPSVVGPPRHECDFGLFFNDDWTPAHLTGGLTNLYKEIAFALKGAEWRQPGLVAVASKIAGSAGEHKPIDVKVPSTYEPATGRNPWLNAASAPASELQPEVGEHKPIDVKVPSTYEPATGRNPWLNAASAPASELQPEVAEEAQRFATPEVARADAGVSDSLTIISDRLKGLLTPNSGLAA